MNTNKSGSGNSIVTIVIIVIVAFVLFRTCRSCTRNMRTTSRYASTASTWQKYPVDELIKKYSDEQNLSILLLDMDAEDPTLGSPKYKHQYRVILERPDTVTYEDTDWYDVSEDIFNKHINDMGMEIASKKDGVVKKQSVPAGYNNYIGNSTYGHWTTRNGNTFWEFYGRYAFMSSMFNLMRPARRSYWDDYRTGGYYGSGRSYYGPSGNTIFGTKNYTSSSSGRNSTWGSKSSDFKSKVRSSVSRSTGASSSRSYSSGSSYSNKTSRSSTRSYSSSSYRSRSGGFGK